ncbi:hypothetical protein H6G06_07145 [Anabaena sphaerica FACHB-251]|uniref:Tetratricopeptide repeat protein n=1 Tax=Anabaena sphaerica FACHB-251 TaxID=2692883 RepID=A0A926WET5_9NOST|nr:hypothetical protein [Anabaena sphaerica]MBD2293266.1 hypothetical protein [Anabaena sphaerica FACHB-251]
MLLNPLLEIYPDSKHEFYINIGNIFKTINKEEEVIKAYQKSLENLGSASSTHYEFYESFTDYKFYVSLVDFYSERENFISVCNQLEKIIPTDPSYRIEFLYQCSQHFE